MGHKNAIRRSSFFCHSQIIVIIEAQYDGYLVAEVWKYLKEDRPTQGRAETIFMTSDYKGKAIIPGIVYHPNDKERFVRTANDFFEDGMLSLVFSVFNAVSHSSRSTEMVMMFDAKTFFVTSERRPDDIIHKFRDQLLGFMRYPIESTDPVAREDKV